jgi:hypothetical protein
MRAFDWDPIRAEHYGQRLDRRTHDRTRPMLQLGTPALVHCRDAGYLGTRRPNADRVAFLRSCFCVTLRMWCAAGSYLKLYRISRLDLKFAAQAFSVLSNRYE